MNPLAGSQRVHVFVGIYRVCFVDVESQATFEGVFSGSGFEVVAAKWFRILLCDAM